MDKEVGGDMGRGNGEECRGRGNQYENGKTLMKE